MLFASLRLMRDELVQKQYFSIFRCDPRSPSILNEQLLHESRLLHTEHQSDMNLFCKIAVLLHGIGIERKEFDTVWGSIPKLHLAEWI